jgi:hypothetical protein
MPRPCYHCGLLNRELAEFIEGRWVLPPHSSLKADPIAGIFRANRLQPSRSSIVAGDVMPTKL